MDRWQTYPVSLQGGLILNMSPFEQAVTVPGSLIQALNFEPAQRGGYRRISGFIKYDSTVVPGSNQVLGVFVFNGGAVAMRGTNVYAGGGSGWTAINGADTRTNAGKYHGHIYKWVDDTLTFVDGVNNPAKYDGTTYTVLSNAPTGAQWVTEHRNHLWFAKGKELTFSAPFDDTNYSAADGAGVINVGSDITGLGSWRGDLYVFSKDRIQKVTGRSKIDFALEPVTDKLGCIDGHTIQEVGGDLVFLGPDGVRTVAGTARIGDVELGSLTERIKPLVSNLGPTYQSGSITGVVVREKAQYRLFATKTADAAETAFGVLGGLRIRNDGNLGWEWFELKGIKVACAHSSYISSTEYILHGGYDGYVYRQEAGQDFDGANVVAILAIPYITYDDPALRKTMQKLDAFIEAEGTTDIRINVVFDYDDQEALQPPEIVVNSVGTTFYTYGDPGTTYDSAVYDTPPELTRKHYLEGSCFNSSFVFSSNDMLAPYTVKDLIVQYALDGRR